MPMILHCSRIDEDEIDALIEICLLGEASFTLVREGSGRRVSFVRSSTQAPHPAGASNPAGASQPRAKPPALNRLPSV
jgi:hypothetical protein